MALAQIYPLLKLAHLTLVAASGGLFAARGAAVLAGRRWPMQKPWRLASMAIDSALLAAGAALWLLLQLHPLRPAWLGSKLLWLVVYIVLGSLALKRAPSLRAQFVCYVLALAVFAFIVSIARLHHPAGALIWLLPE